MDNALTRFVRLSGDRELRFFDDSCRWDWVSTPILTMRPTRESEIARHPKRDDSSNSMPSQSIESADLITRRGVECTSLWTQGGRAVRAAEGLRAARTVRER